VSTSRQKPTAFLGIDVGTTHAKISTSGPQWAADKCIVKRHGMFDSSCVFEDEFRRLLSWIAATVVAAHRQSGVRAIAVSGVAATLLGRSQDGLWSLLSAHTDGAAELSGIDPLIARQSRTAERVDVRLARLPHRYQPVDCLTMTGAIVFELTGVRAVDSTSYFELGNTDAVFSEIAGHPPDVRAPLDIVGLTHSERMPQGVPVIAGTTDTLASLTGAGCRVPADRMNYYGSYLCQISSGADIRHILQSELLSEPPATIHLSVRRGGLVVEKLLSDFYAAPRETIFDVKGAEIGRIPLASPATHPFVVTPRHSEGQHSGSAIHAAIFGIEELGISTPGLDIGILGLFGYKLCAANTGARIDRVFTAGGGSRCGRWVELTSEISGTVQHMVSGSSGAAGTAHLARAAIEGRLPDPVIVRRYDPSGEWDRDLRDAFRRYEDMITLVQTA
jgi:sugar (pentulose or hexulose) kinase